jgi:chromosome segregation ATPase
MPNMDDPHGTANSSAYSSLANSNGDVRTDASASPDIPASTGTTSILPASKMQQGVEVTSAEEIRRIIDDYNQTLAKATAKIKSLTKERNNLEVDYEKLMTLNEGIATDLEKTVRYKRRLEEEHEAVLKANDELFEEAQRLNDEESVWIEDKETLEAELKRLRSEVEDLRRNEAEREAGERLADKTIRQMDELKAEKDELADTVTKLEIDSKKLSKVPFIYYVSTFKGLEGFQKLSKSFPKNCPKSVP